MYASENTQTVEVVPPAPRISHYVENVNRYEED
jgi:hypothetical protein